MNVGALRLQRRNSLTCWPRNGARARDARKRRGRQSLACTTGDARADPPDDCAQSSDAPSRHAHRLTAWVGYVNVRSQERDGLAPIGMRRRARTLRGTGHLTRGRETQGGDGERGKPVRKRAEARRMHGGRFCSGAGHGTFHRRQFVLALPRSLRVPHL